MLPGSWMLILFLSFSAFVSMLALFSHLCLDYFYNTEKHLSITKLKMEHILAARGLNCRLAYSEFVPLRSH